jgi:methionine aminopeptidase
MKEGMVLAIEPMVNKGRKEVTIKLRIDRGNAGWKPVGHFEHTVAITQMA